MSSYNGFLWAMGQRAIAAKDDVGQGDVERWDDTQDRVNAETSAITSLFPLPAQFDGFQSHNVGSCFQPIVQWVRSLAEGDDLQGMWLSSYQLLIHFQSMTGKIGLWHDRPNKQWLLADEYAREHGFDFCKFAAWLISALKVFAKACQLPLNVQSRLPWGSCFRSWQGCMFLQTSVTAFTKVDSLLRARGAVAVKTVAVFKQYDGFCEGQR